MAADDDLKNQLQQPSQPSPSDVMQGGDDQSFDPFSARPELIDSIIHHESSGRPGAISPKGARGLMQVMPHTAAQYGVSPQQLMDPEINKQVGTQYFSDLLKQYKGNEFLALVAYNEGPGNLSKGKFFPQSVHYATSVLDRAGSRLKGLWQGAESALGFGDQGQQQQQPPQQTAQAPQAQGQQDQAMLPWMLGKIGGGLSSLLGEGTAQAEETPPPDAGAAAPPAAPPTATPPTPPGAPPGAPPPTPPTAAPPGAPPAAAPPPAALPPMAGGGSPIMVDPSGRTAGPTAPPAPPQQGSILAPNQPLMQRQSVMVDSNGRTVERFAAAKIPESQQSMAGASVLGLSSVAEAKRTFETKIKPHEKDFEGTFLDTPVNALRGMAQWTEYSSSRFTEPFGMKVDRDVATLYSQIGPVMGMQLKALVGGRIGQYMLQGPLAKHIPNGETDSIRMIYQKLTDLEPILQKNLKVLNQMKEAGVTDEDQLMAGVVQSNGETPVYYGGHVVGGVSPGEGD